MKDAPDLVQAFYVSSFTGEQVGDIPSRHVHAPGKFRRIDYRFNSVESFGHIVLVCILWFNVVNTI